MRNWQSFVKAVRAQVPALIRLMFPNFTRELAEDILQFAQEVDRLESEIAKRDQQIALLMAKNAETEKRIKDLLDERNTLAEAIKTLLE